jgi:hypothetical protein
MSEPHTESNLPARYPRCAERGMAYVVMGRKDKITGSETTAIAVFKDRIEGHGWAVKECTAYDQWWIDYIPYCPEQNR